MRRAAIGVVLVAQFLLPPASADEVARPDPNDQRGILDIASAVHGHKFAFGRWKLEHKVTMRGPWQTSELNHNDGIRLEFQLAGHPDSPPERAIRIFIEDGRLKAQMYNTLGDPPRFEHNVAVYRPSPRSVAVSFSRKLLRKHGYSFYKWSVTTVYETARGTDCDQPDTCTDRAPDSGRYRHELKR